MNGTVVGRQPEIRVNFILPNGQKLGIDFVIDTGFEGMLTLPPYAVAAMQLPYAGPISANLADNTDCTVDQHEAIIEWHGRDVLVTVLAMGKRPLLGTAMLEGSDVGIRFEDSGPIIINKF